MHLLYSLDFRKIFGFLMLWCDLRIFFCFRASVLSDEQGLIFRGIDVVDWFSLDCRVLHLNFREIVR